MVCIRQVHGDYTFVYHTMRSKYRIVITFLFSSHMLSSHHIVTKSFGSWFCLNALSIKRQSRLQASERRCIDLFYAIKMGIIWTSSVVVIIIVLASIVIFSRYLKITFADLIVLFFLVSIAKSIDFACVL